MNRRLGQVFAAKTESGQPSTSITTNIVDRSAPCSNVDERMRIFDDEIALAYPPNVAEKGKEYSGKLHGGLDWYEFFLRPQEYDDSLFESIKTELNNQYGEKSDRVVSLKKRGFWHSGLPCAARYKNDNNWYRARLEDINYQMVRFVDYGNCQICAEDDIKPLPRAIAEISPPACLRCTMTETSQEYPLFPTTTTPKITVKVSNSTEPYEVALVESSIQKLLPRDEAMQMVKDNLNNHLQEERHCSEAVLLEIPVETNVELPSTVEIELVDEASAAFSVLTPVVVSTPPADSHHRTVVKSPFNCGRRRVVEQRSIGCQTDEENAEKMRKLRLDAMEDLRKLRNNDKDLFLFMKLALYLGEEAQQKFFALLKCSFD